MATDQRTRDYVVKRTAQGKGKLEIMRCLKRYVAREIHRVLRNPRPAPLTNDLRQRRLALGLTQVRVARELGTLPTTISRLEQAKSRDRDLVSRYREWLEEQPKTSA
jgi:transposase